MGARVLTAAFVVLVIACDYYEPNADAEGKEPIPLVCTWAPYATETESFLIFEDEGRIEWVNRGQSLPLESSSGRFAFAARPISIVYGPDGESRTFAPSVILNRVSGEWELFDISGIIDSALAGREVKVSDFAMGPCAVRRAF